MDYSTIAVAALALVGTLSGSYFAHHKATALISYRLEELEKKVNKHNNLVERVYHLEEEDTLYEEKIKVINHRIDDLEDKE